MDRKIIPLVLILVLLVSAVTYGGAMDGEIKVVDYMVTDYTGENSRVVLPRLRGFKSYDLEREINQKIEREALKDIKDFNFYAKNDTRLDIKYSLIENENIISIIVEKSRRENARDLKQENIYINIDRQAEKLLGLEDFFETESYLNILRDSFKAEGLEITKDQDFYLDEAGDLVLVFNNDKSKLERVEKKVRREGSEENIIEDVREGVNILKENIDLGLKGDISIILPKLSGLENQDFQDQVNKIIRSDLDREIEKFRSNIGSRPSDENEFKVNFKIYGKDEILSLELTVYKYIESSSLAETKKYYYNIDVGEGKILSLEDMFKDPAYINSLNSSIKESIQASKSKYYTDSRKFSSLDKNSKFYIDKYGNLVVCFDEGQIASLELGLPQFKLSFYSIRDLVDDRYRDLGVRDLERLLINSKSVELKNPMYISNQGTLMLAIKEVADELGIKVDFNSKAKLLTLTSGNKTSTISIKDNLYTFMDSKVFLEDEAKAIKGVTYVPHKYIDNVLKGKTYFKDGVLNIDYK